MDEKFKGMKAIFPLVLFLLLFYGTNQSGISKTKNQNRQKPSLIKGKKLFEKKLCIDCHKGGGNSLRPSKPIKGMRFNSKYTDDKKLGAAIRAGNPKRGMPSFGVHVINENELRDLIYYVRNFSKKDAVNKKKAEKKK